jgi:hypothetical protein
VGESEGLRDDPVVRVPHVSHLYEACDLCLTVLS